MKPQVTIGILTRNRAKYLKQAVETALNQDTDRPYEILIHDDASSDTETLEYLDSCSNELIRVVTSQTQGGEGKSRNSVIDAMRGDFVLWLDDDDCLTRNALSSHLSCLEAHPEADVIYGNLIRTDENLTPTGNQNFRQIPEGFLFYTMLFYSPFPNGGSMIRKSVFERSGSYDTSFPTAVDYDFWTRAAIAGCRFFHNDTAMYLYRRHEANAALGKEDAVFCEMNSRIVSNLIERVPIQKIFPQLSWKENPNAAFSFAMAALAVVFLRYKQLERALSIIAQGEQKLKTRELHAVKGMILRASGAHAQAAAVLEESLLAHNQELLGILRMAGMLR